MSPRRGRLALISFGLAALPLVSACLNTDNAEEKIADAWCDYRMKCGDFPDHRTCMAVTFDGDGEADADAHVDPQRQAAVGAGRITIDLDRARGCIRAIKDLECRRDQDPAALTDEACAGVFVGQVAPEEPCMIDDECVGERSRCGFDPNCGDACCPGACRLIDGPAAIGEPCSAATFCADDAFCDQGTCAPAAALGEPCNGTPCGAGTLCDWDTRTCILPRSVGDPCIYAWECNPAAFCGADGTCAKRGDRGEACDPNAPAESCLRGTDSCKEGRCSAPAEPGEACQHDAECVGWAFCFENNCVAYQDVGESCTIIGASQRCYPGLRCNDGTCGPDPDPDDACLLPE